MRCIIIGCLALVLAGCGRAKSTSELAAQLKDADAAHRVQAVKALSQRPAEADVAVPVLTEALKDENSYVRRDAATALGRFGATAKPAVPTLTRLLKDKERSVRKAAADALQHIDPETGAKATRR